MSEQYDIVIIIKNLSYKSFDVEFKNMKDDKVHFMFTKYKNELLEIIDGAAAATFYKNNEGFSNRMTAAFVYFVEKVLIDQYYTRACVILDVPWVSQGDLLDNKSEILARIEFDLDYVGPQKKKAS